MKILSRILNKDAIFALTLLAAIVTFQPFMIMLTIGFWLVWEDSKWPAFDSENYDEKTMNGALSAWNRGD